MLFTGYNESTQEAKGPSRNTVLDFQSMVKQCKSVAWSIRILVKCPPLHETSTHPCSILVSGCAGEKKTRLNCKNSSLQSSSVSPLDNPCQRCSVRANNLLSSIAAGPEQREVGFYHCHTLSNRFPTRHSSALLPFLSVWKIIHHVSVARYIHN